MAEKKRKAELARKRPEAKKPKVEKYVAVLEHRDAGGECAIDVWKIPLKDFDEIKKVVEELSIPDPSYDSKDKNGSKWCEWSESNRGSYCMTPTNFGEEDDDSSVLAGAYLWPCEATYVIGDVENCGDDDSGDKDDGGADAGSDDEDFKPKPGEKKEKMKKQTATKIVNYF
jgi:hypothetical protein